MFERSRRAVEHAFGVALAVLVLAVIAFGCSSKKAEKKSRLEDDTPADSAPAHEAEPTTGQRVTDERLEDLDYKFVMRRPDKAWRLLGEVDAQAIGVVSIRAGFLGPDNLVGSVAIDEFPEANLDLHLDEILRSKGAAVQMQVEERAEITFASVPARRLALAIVEDGHARRECDVVVHLRGFLFVIGATQPATAAQPRGCGFLDPFLAGFSIEEGQPVARGPVVPKEDVVGTTFRLKQGVFESAAGQFRLRSTDGAAIVAGDSAKAYHGAAEVAVLYASPPAVLAMRADPTVLLDPKGALDGYVAQLQQYAGATPTGRTSLFSFLGRDLVLRELDTPTYAWWVGLDYVDGRATFVTGWTPKGTRTEASARFKGTLDAIEPLDPIAASNIQAQIDATPFDDNRAELNYALRRGVYHDFAWGIRWERPARTWSVQVGQAARAIDPYALVTARLRGTDVQCSLEVFDQHVAHDAFHKLMRELLATQAGLTWGKSTKAKLDGRDALRSSGASVASGLGYRATTRVEAGRDYAVLCYGPTRALDDHPEAADAFESALHFDTRAAVVEDAGTISDLQLGFGLALSTPWTMRARVAGTGHAIVAGDATSRIVEAHAAPSRAHFDAAFAVAFTLRAELAGLGLAPTEDEPSLSETTLAGRPATRFVFKAVTGAPIECVSMQVGEVRYAILARGEGAYAEAVAAFRLLGD